MSDIIGKWVMHGGMFDGLWFEFKPDGSYVSELPRLVKITASGVYTVSEGGLIDMNQTQHTMHLVGSFAGRYAVEGDTLKLAFPPVPGGPRPVDVSGGREYHREA